MSKGTHFIGQPLYKQVTFFINRQDVLAKSHQAGGEKYVKKFDAWHHLITMLYAVIKRLDSIREIEVAMSAEANKFMHLGLSTIPRKSTLSDANNRRSETIFEAIYFDLYKKNRSLLSDSQKGDPEWLNHLKIMDSTTISLFSNLIFKGVGRDPLSGKKKGGIKVHTIIHANEGVPCSVNFTSAAKHDNFMLCPEKIEKDDILAIDRAYIDYKKFEELTEKGAIYVTKMKKGLVYEVEEDIMYQNMEGLMSVREQKVIFTKKTTENIIKHKARIVTYVDLKDGKPRKISLLSNDFSLSTEDIIAIYKKRWTIESLFKQLKQNFPLRYFYGESENAIKIQIWVTLIANLLLTLLKRNVKRNWSFSNLATMVRILLMHYINYRSYFENPDKERFLMIKRGLAPPEQPTLF